MKILKFGGSSVANSENIQKVIQIVSAASAKDKVAVVVSAFGKTTNKLIAAANKAANNDPSYIVLFNEVTEHHTQVISDLIFKEKQSEVQEKVNTLFNQLQTLLEGCFLLSEVTPKTMATISGFGERLSSYIISEVAKNTLNATYKDSRQLIITSNIFDKAQVKFTLTNKNCQDFFKNNPHQVTVLPGFIAKSENGLTTTLGRGGSDYTAAIYAAALQANELQIWTDVSGMYTANPSIVKQAFPIPEISYQEAMELSHFGAKVIYPPTIQPALEKEIPIVIKNTFEPTHVGTLIAKDLKSTNLVKGISHIEDITLLTLEGTGM
ncbi:aspartate kinase, partial [Tenacibaculum piscium]